MWSSIFIWATKVTKEVLVCFAPFRRKIVTTPVGYFSFYTIVRCMYCITIMLLDSFFSVQSAAKSSVAAALATDQERATLDQERNGTTTAASMNRQTFLGRMQNLHTFYPRRAIASAALKIGSHESPFSHFFSYLFRDNLHHTAPFFT